MVNGPIVILEDDTDDQEILKEIFLELQVKNELRFFTEGEATFDYLKTTREKPFLILSDINMPGMNGLLFREKIMEDEVVRKKSIPFIFFTTSASRLAVEQAYDLTVQGFFIKPPTFIDLRERISYILKYWTHCVHPNAL